MIITTSFVIMDLHDSKGLYRKRRFSPVTSNYIPAGRQLIEPPPSSAPVNEEIPRFPWAFVFFQLLVFAIAGAALAMSIINITSKNTQVEMEFGLNGPPGLNGTRGVQGIQGPPGFNTSFSLDYIFMESTSTSLLISNANIPLVTNSNRGITNTGGLATIQKDSSYSLNYYVACNQACGIFLNVNGVIRSGSNYFANTTGITGFLIQPFSSGDTVALSVSNVMGIGSVSIFDAMIPNPSITASLSILQIG